MGAHDGFTTLARPEGACDGTTNKLEGASVGIKDGFTVEGVSVGISLGYNEGTCDGAKVGAAEG